MILKRLVVDLCEVSPVDPLKILDAQRCVSRDFLQTSVVEDELAVGLVSLCF